MKPHTRKSMKGIINEDIREIEIQTYSERKETDQKQGENQEDFC